MGGGHCRISAVKLLFHGQSVASVSENKNNTNGSVNEWRVAPPTTDTQKPQRRPGESLPTLLCENGEIPGHDALGHWPVAASRWPPYSSFFSSPAPSVSSPATLDATPRTWRRWVGNLATKTQIENKLKTVLVCGKWRFDPLRSKLWSLNWNRESPGDSWIFVFFFNLHWTQMIPPLFPEREEKKSHRATESL